MLLVCHNDHVVVLIFYRGRVTRNYYDAIAMESKTGHSTHTSIFYTLFLHTTKPHIMWSAVKMYYCSVVRLNNNVVLLICEYYIHSYLSLPDHYYST